MDGVRQARQARGEERRRRILKATLDVVGRGGILAVTHRSVAAEAGVPLGSLTYWFATKDDLLREALRLYVHEDVERLRGLGAALLDAGAEPEEVVARYAELLESLEPGHVSQFELYLEAARNPALREVAAESLEAYAGVAELALRAAGVPDPAAAAGVIVAAVDGLGLQRAAAGERAPDLRAALGVLLRALTATGRAEPV